MRWNGGRNTCCCIPRSAARCCTWACPACCACCRRMHRSASTIMSTSRWNRARPGTAILRFTDPRRFGCLLWQAPGRDACTARRARTRAAHRGLRRRPAVAAVARPQGGGEAVPDGQRERGGRGQHLRQRGAVRRRHRSAPRGRGGLARPLRAARAGGEAHPGLGDRTRRHHAARLPQSRRRARLFLPRAQRLRPRRRTLPCLRHADPPGRCWASAPRSGARPASAETQPAGKPSTTTASASSAPSANTSRRHGRPVASAKASTHCIT